MKSSNNYSLQINPSKLQLNQLKEWLINEHNESDEHKGFYCNWKSIQRSFEDKELVVLLSNDDPIGFATLIYTSEHTSEIQLFEIKPTFRGQGAATWFSIKLFDFFIKKKIYAVSLQCKPEESEAFWKKVGFIDMPEGIKFFAGTHLYKLLIPTLKPVLRSMHSTYVEVWNNEPFIARNEPSKWKWLPDINMETGIFKLPIIHPCRSDWRIRAIQNGDIIIDDKIKRFGNLEIDYGNFLIIEEFPK